MVGRPFVVLWVDGSISRGGPIELFFVPASVPRQRPWYVLSWDGAYKRSLLIFLK